MSALSAVGTATVLAWLLVAAARARGRTRLRHRVDYRLIGGPLGAFVAQAVKALGVTNILRNGTLAQKHQAEES